jgi:MoxR-like ATPase
VLQATTEAVERMPIDDVFEARAAVLDLHLAPPVERYLIELVLASRDRRATTPRSRAASHGARARAVRSRSNVAHVRRAWLAGRDFVTPEDVRAIAPDVLRHRVLPSYEATAEGWDGDRLVRALLDKVPLP